MRDIIYYVATSIDGFIAGPNEDIRGFVGEGTGVKKYLDDLQSFDTVIMGRRTYEFGYRFGLKPGQPAYPRMRHFIFSKTLRFDEADSKVTVCEPDLEIIRKLKSEAGTPIYLCGGGELAGWLLENEEIDILRIKLNPLLLGQGTKLFGNSKKVVKTEILDTNLYENGLQIITYKLRYHWTAP